MMRPLRKSMLVALVCAGLVILGMAGFAIAEEAPSAALTNDDVVKLAKLGFGDDAIIAKIKQAPKTDFKLEVSDLEKLKTSGVSQAVITAMINRSSAPAAGAAPVPSPMGMEQPEEAGAVKLVTKDKGEIALESIGGSQSVAYAVYVALTYMNYPGLQSGVRTTDTQPSILLRSTKSPVGRYFFVEAEPDDDDNIRSVKLGNVGMWGAKNINAPDSDNQIACDVVEESPTNWRMTPKKPLKAGEYGLFIPSGEIYDFGIDKVPGSKKK